MLTAPDRRRARIAALVAAALAGCAAGDGLDRRPIAGVVTLDGRPLAAGSILFEPADAESGTVVGASIRDGRFDVPRRDGPVPGRYAVRIYSASAEQAPPRAGESPRKPRPMVEAIPARYNTQSTLTAEVGPGESAAFRFDLRTGDDGPPRSPHP